MNVECHIACDPATIQFYDIFFPELFFVCLFIQFFNSYFSYFFCIFFGRIFLHFLFSLRYVYLYDPPRLDWHLVDRPRGQQILVALPNLDNYSDQLRSHFWQNCQQKVLRKMSYRHKCDGRIFVANMPAYLVNINYNIINFCYPAFFDIRYPAGYPVSFSGYPDIWPFFMSGIWPDNRINC